MNRPKSWLVSLAAAVASVAFAQAAQADFELSDSQGRRILLKDDGTWRYVDPSDKGQAQEKLKDTSEAALRLERKIERGNGCRFAVRLFNTLPYEIRSFVPSFSAYRTDGIIYDTVSSPSSFNSMKPGNEQEREFEFNGIRCQDISRVQVVGGDRCEMGELHRFSDGKGQCLARLRVLPSDIVRFDK